MAKLSMRTKTARMQQAAELKRKGQPIPRELKKYAWSCRAYNRCQLCGRDRAYYRKFKCCRLCLRKLASEGMIPGMTKASW